MTDESVNADSSAEVSPLDEELSAYLDGELPPDESRRVEGLLSSDSAVRRRLRGIELSWEALDRLPTAPLNDQFTHTTMEMVAMAAQDDLAATCGTMPSFRRRRWALLLAGLALAGAVGFALVAWLRPDPDRKLLEDLPVMEHLDQYRQVQDPEFRKWLVTEHLFDEEHPAAPDSPPAAALGTTSHPLAEETIPQRRQRVEKMNPTDKSVLRRRYELFASLGADEQRQWRQLHQELQQSPQLQGAVERYYTWFNAQPPYRQAELMSLDSTDRIKKIKAWRAEQKLRPEDFVAVKHWFDQYIARPDIAAVLQKSVLQNLPEKSRQKFEKMPPSDLKRTITTMFAWRSLQPRPQDLAELRANLTPETQQRLAAKSSTEIWQMVGDAVRENYREQMAAKTPGELWKMVGEVVREYYRQQSDRGPKSWAAMIDDSDLARYFESLPFEQRDRLLTLPADEMQRELRQMYLARSKGGDGSEPRPSRTGKKPGDHSGRTRPKSPAGSAAKVPNAPFPATN